MAAFRRTWSWSASASGWSPILDRSDCHERWRCIAAAAAAARCGSRLRRAAVGRLLPLRRLPAGDRRAGFGLRRLPCRRGRALTGDDAAHLRERRGDAQLLRHLRLADRLCRPAPGRARLLHARRHGPPANYKPTLHAYVREQLPFVHMPDGLPRYPKTSVPRPDGDDTMKLTLSWLKDHLETDASLAEIVERLTSIGLEVEAVDDKSSLKPFVIARVLTAEQHPDADRLQRADRRYRRRPAAGAGGVRRAQCARRAGRRLRRARRLYPGHRHDARRSARSAASRAAA